MIPKENLLARILEIYKHSPRVAILMSGQGSNAAAILSQAYRYPSVKFVAICTDKPQSKASELSKFYELDYFCLEGAVKLKEDRERYFQQFADYLRSQKIDTLLYAGFMKISTPTFVKEFPGINVHPADLTIKDANGKPKYIGMDVIRDALNNGESYLASTAHVVDADVDCGTPIMVSKHVVLEDRQDINALHEELKITAEHKLFPRVLELMANGQLNAENMPYSWDEQH